MSFLWALSDIRTPFLDTLFQFVTYFGQELLLIGVICALYWCVDKKLATQIGFTYITAGLCVQGLKITFRIPRPWILDPDFKAVESALPAATGYSFPSGHTQGAASLFAPLALNAKKRSIKLLCTSVFLLVGFSRMYLGCHTPKDVLTAIAVSLLFSWLIWRYKDLFTGPASHVGLIAFLVAVAAAGICVYSYVLYQSGVIEAHYASDCFKASGAALGFAAGWFLEQKLLDFDAKPGTLHQKVLRFFVGLLITALLQFGLKALIGHTLAGKTIQHFIVIFWVIFLYPYIFTRLKKQI